MVKAANSTEDHLPTTSLQTPPRPVPLSLKSCHGIMEARGSSGPLCWSQEPSSLPQLGAGQPWGNRAAPGTSLGPGQDMGPRVVLAQQAHGQAQQSGGGAGDLLCCGVTGAGAEMGSWAMGRVGRGSRALMRAFISDSKDSSACNQLRTLTKARQAGLAEDSLV